MMFLARLDSSLAGPGSSRSPDSLQPTWQPAAAMADAMQAESGVDVADLDPPEKKRRRTGSSKPEFSSDARYQVLVPLFGVANAKDLNAVRLERFQQVAAELLLAKQGVTKALGSFKSYAAAVDTILDNLSRPNRDDRGDDDTPDGAGLFDEVEEAPPAAEEAVTVAEALVIVERMLDGDDLDFELMDLSDTKVKELERAVLQECDKRENELREQFASMTSSEETVNDVLAIMKVCLKPLATRTSPPPSLLCWLESHLLVRRSLGIRRSMRTSCMTSSG